MPAMRSAPDSSHDQPLVKAAILPRPSPSLSWLWGSARVAFVLHAMAMVGVLTIVTALIERAAP